MASLDKSIINKLCIYFIINNTVLICLKALYNSFPTIKVSTFCVLLSFQSFGHVSHLIHRQAWSHPCISESRYCLRTVCPSWSAYTPHTPFKETKHRSGPQLVSSGPRVHDRADSLLHGAGVRAGGTFVTSRPIGPWLGALTGPAHALAPPAAQQAQIGHAGVSASGAVAVLTLPVWCTLTEATVTDAMTWDTQRRSQHMEQHAVFCLRCQLLLLCVIKTFPHTISRSPSLSSSSDDDEPNEMRLSEEGRNQGCGGSQEVRGRKEAGAFGGCYNFNRCASLVWNNKSLSSVF